MHVSLPRRHYHVRQAMPFLLWLGFGVLAVMPWRVLCGQDLPASDAGQAVERQNSIWGQRADDPVFRTPDSVDSGRRNPAPLRTLSSPGQVFRGQDAPLQMAPLQINPQDRGPEMEDPGFLGSDMITGRNGQALGSFFQIGGITGPAVGRKNSIFPIEWMPYSLVENNLFFADIRGFRGSNDTWGGNFGGGYRRYLPRIDRILGVNAYFDYDTSSGATFRQVGFGAEWLGSDYDVRANAYLPTGDSAAQLGLVNLDGTQKFIGHYLFVDQQRTIANALHGFDAEIGIPLPGRLARRHDVRVFGGGYWYEGTYISAFGGWRTRIQANLIPSIAMNLEISHDEQFKTNVVFGGSWRYGGFRQSPDQPKTQYDRMTTPVIRNYNMIVGMTTRTDKGVNVINPETNQPYFFEHVASYAPAGGDGTVENPFNVFSDAQTAPLPIGVHRDIIFVHAGSTFDGVGVNLQEGVRVLGESSSIQHIVQTDAQNSNSNLGNTLFLPHPTTGPTAANRPLFTRAPGDGVTLANRSEFSGFQVGDINDSTSGPAGRGIVGDGVRDVVVRQTSVSYSGLQGVLLNNTLGNIVFSGDTINDSAGTANTFEVTNTRGNVLFTTDTIGGTTPGVINNVQGTGGSALVVDSTLAGSIVSLTGSTVNDTNGNGIIFSNNAGSATLGFANVTDSLGIGLHIFNGLGQTFTDGTINITGSQGDSIVVENMVAGSLVNFQSPSGSFPSTSAVPGFDVIVSDRNARGIYLNNNAGSVTFSTGAEVDATASLSAPAIEYQGSSGNVSFNAITINRNTTTDFSGPGILIGRLIDDNTGSFTVNGNTLINNTSGTAIQVTDDSSRVVFASALNTGTTTINSRGGIGIQVLANDGTVTFQGTTNINNQNAVNLPAIDIRRNTVVTDSSGNIVSSAAVVFDAVNIQAAQGPAAAGFGGVGVNIGGATLADANPAPVSFNVLNIGNVQPTQDGTSLYVNHEGQGTGTSATGLTITAGTINSVGGTAVDIQNSDILVRLTSVSSSASGNIIPQFGINLIDNRVINQGLLPQLDSFMFQVSAPTTTAISQLTGGNIRDSSIAGVNLVQTNNGGQFQNGGVSLNNITIQSNQAGIIARNLLQLNVFNTNISNNLGGSATDTGVGIDASNLPYVNVLNSQFTNNGRTLTDHAIYLHTTVPLLLPPASTFNNPTNGRYLWNISGNNNTNGFNGGFTGSVGSGDLVLVRGNLPGGGDLTYTLNTVPIQTFATPLVFAFNNNTVNMQAGPANSLVSGVHVDWSGQIDNQSSVVNTLFSSLSGNTFFLTGNDSAMSIENSTNIYTTNFSVNANTITANNGGNVGLFVNTFSQTNLQIGNGANNGNIFNFNTPAQNQNGTAIDTGMQISIFNSTTLNSLVNISNNQITMTNGTQDQGLLFPNIQAPATFIINNNTISIQGAQVPPLAGQAINFQAISKPTVVLSGTVSNTVLINGSTSTAFQNAWFNRQPANSTTGQIIINGFAGP